MSVHIEKNLSISGDLTAGEDMTVNFTLDGSIQLPGHHLTMTPGSQVHASVSARVVTVHGRFEGQIETEQLTLTSGAQVNATVITTKFSMQEGALFNGSVNTERARAAGEVARHRASQR
jgi:cytoskeletal protein CcmA (bactofilin family)